MLHEKLVELKNKGLENAATAWVSLTAIEPPIDPIDIFKAVCSVKCAEMLARFIKFDASENLAELVIVADFMDATINVAGGAETGDKAEGLRAIDAVEKMFPFDQTAFHDPGLFAIRMHTLDGVLLLSAQRFGKEQEVKDLILSMQKGFMKVVIQNFITASANEAT